MAFQDVTLTWQEYEKAARVGFERHLRATSKRYKGNVPHAWTSDIEGACAEAAVNKFLFNRPEAADDGTWGGADFPCNVEVKSFWRDSGGAISLRSPKVNDAERKFVFVERLGLRTSLMPTFRIHGCLTGDEVDSLLKEDVEALKRRINENGLADPGWLKDEINTFVPEELQGLTPREQQAHIAELGDGEAYLERFNEQLEEWLAERGFTE